MDAGAEAVVPAIAVPPAARETATDDERGDGETREPFQSQPQVCDGQPVKGGRE